MNEMEFQDQTFFSANQPILDDGGSLDEQENLQPAPVKSKKKLIIIIAISLVALVFILTGVWVMTRKSQSDPQTSILAVPSASPTSIDTNDVVFERLDQLEKTIDVAEPRSDKLPFPPVRMDINLEED